VVIPDHSEKFVTVVIPDHSDKFATVVIPDHSERFATVVIPDHSDRFATVVIPDHSDRFATVVIPDHSERLATVVIPDHLERQKLRLEHIATSMHFHSQDEAILFTYRIHQRCWLNNNAAPLVRLVEQLNIFDDYIVWFYTNQLPSRRESFSNRIFAPLMVEHVLSHTHNPFD
jgi:hypothetical protein